MTATANTNFSDSCQAFVFNNNDASLNGYSITLEMVSPPAGAYFLDNGLTTLTLLSSGGQIANSGMHAGSGLGTFQIIGYSTADGHASPYLPNCFWQLTVRDPTLSYAINVNSGNGQSSDVGIPFAAALTAMVVNNVGTPLAGKSVTFTAPASGTSCTFAGSNTQTVTTDGSGIATSSVPVANAVVGTYSVQATTPGVAIPATFTLTNSTPATPAQPHDGLLYCEM
jgi:hypothetical protein